LRPSSIPKGWKLIAMGRGFWQQESYAYDDAGNITQIGARRFTYDGLSRLTSASYPGVSVPPYREYLYDRFGNLIGVNRGSGKASPDTVTVPYSTSISTNQMEPPAAAYDRPAV
jgi:hypothetical protein